MGHERPDAADDGSLHFLIGLTIFVVGTWSLASILHYSVERRGIAVGKDLVASIFAGRSKEVVETN